MKINCHITLIIFKEICQKRGRIHFYCINHHFLQIINIFFFLQSATLVTKFQEVQSSKINSLNHKTISSIESHRKNIQSSNEVLLMLIVCKMCRRADLQHSCSISVLCADNENFTSVLLPMHSALAEKCM